MSEKLLPCPFDGAWADMEVSFTPQARDAAMVVIRCTECPVTLCFAGPESEAREAAVDAWNTRAAPPSENVQQSEPTMHAASVLLYYETSVLEVNEKPTDEAARARYKQAKAEMRALLAASRGDVGGQPEPYRWLVEEPSPDGAWWFHSLHTYEAEARRLVKHVGGHSKLRVVPLYLAPTEPEVSNG